MPERTPCRLLDAADVTAAMREIDALDVMRGVFNALARGQASQPPQTLTLFPDGSGDFITYMGVLAQENVFGAKLSPYITRSGTGHVTAWTLLMSMDSGEPVLLCDSKQLTLERTGATTALAVDMLAPSSAKRLAVIGSGPVAQVHIRYVARLRAWSDIRVYSQRLAASTARSRELSCIDPRLRCVASNELAVHDADVILLCTSSGTPVLDPNALSRPALITSTTTNVVRAHEVPPASLNGMDVYCDLRATAQLAAGEMLIAAAEHGWNHSAIAGDLPECMSGRAHMPTYGRHAYFRSIGLGIEDIAIASALISNRRGPS